jgi:LemA protein
MIVGLVIVGVLLVAVAAVAMWWVKSYNALVGLANRVDGAWANIDTQLKRRADLIPNIVETVKGYASHESETLEAVIAARNAATTATTPAAAAQADTMLTGALRQVFALAESYPQLKANENFLQLQGELTSTENGIASVRQSYNNQVQQLNTIRAQFPMNIVAGSNPRFAAREYFEVTSEADREAPEVKF